MSTYVLKRLMSLVPVLAGVSLLLFLMMEMIPGDAAEAMLGPYATPENVERLRRSMDLEGSLPVRYTSWLKNVLRLDFGQAYSIGRPVRDEVFERFSATLRLASAAFLISVMFGILCGGVAAIFRERMIGRLIESLSLVGISVPAFWIGLVLVSVFSVELGWLPSGGMSSIHRHGGWVLGFEHLLLPSISLGIVSSAVVARFARSAFLDSLDSPHVRVARSKGIGEWRVLVVHVLRNAMPGLMPVLGLQAGFVIGGAVYIETVFQWPGIGRMLVQAIQARDLLLVQGGVLVLGTTYLLINLMADILQHAFDPKLSK